MYKKIFEAFRISTKKLSDKTPSETAYEAVLRFNVFDASLLKYISAVCCAASGAGIGAILDVPTGGMSLGACTALGGTIGSVVGYVGASACDYNYKGKRLSLKLTSPVMLLLIGLGVSTARALKNRGQANPHDVSITYDRRAFRPSNELKKLYTKSWTSPETKQLLKKELQAAIER